MGLMDELVKIRNKSEVNSTHSKHLQTVTDKYTSELYDTVL